MFDKKELETTIRITQAKIDDLLHSDKGTDEDYIRDLQTLSKLKDAAEKKLDKAI